MTWNYLRDFVLLKDKVSRNERVPEKPVVVAVAVATGELLCSPINQQFVGHRGKPFPSTTQLPFLHPPPAPALASSAC